MSKGKNWLDQGSSEEVVIYCPDCDNEFRDSNRKKAERQLDRHLREDCRG